MEQRQAVRIPVKLHAQLVRDDERDARWGRRPRRATTSSEIECGCGSNSTACPAHHHGAGRGEGRHASAGLSLVPERSEAPGRSSAPAIVGVVEDLSRTGLFLRTQHTLPPGTSTTVILELPLELSEEAVGAVGAVGRVCLHGQVVRVGQGARAGLGVHFASEQPARRQLANYLMRCHAHRS
jgi:PilZ domain